MVGQLQQLVQGGDGSTGEFRVKFHAEIEGLQLGHGHILNMTGAGGGTADVVVVADGVLLVGGQMDVGFKAVGAHVQRELKGGQGIFRRVRGRARDGLEPESCEDPFSVTGCFLLYNRSRGNNKPVSADFYKLIKIRHTGIEKFDSLRDTIPCSILIGRK